MTGPPNCRLTLHTYPLTQEGIHTAMQIWKALTDLATRLRDFAPHPHVVGDTATEHAVDVISGSRHSTEPHVSKLHLCASWIRSKKQSRFMHDEENFDCSTNSATVWA
jgi:hypothetical protein